MPADWNRHTVQYREVCDACGGCHGGCGGGWGNIFWGCQSGCIAQTLFYRIEVSDGRVFEGETGPLSSDTTSPVTAWGTPPILALPPNPDPPPGHSGCSFTLNVVIARSRTCEDAWTTGNRHPPGPPYLQSPPGQVWTYVQEPEPDWILPGTPGQVQSPINRASVQLRPCHTPPNDDPENHKGFYVQFGIQWPASGAIVPGFSNCQYTMTTATATFYREDFCRPLAHVSSGMHYWCVTKNTYSDGKWAEVVATAPDADTTPQDYLTGPHAALLDPECPGSLGEPEYDDEGNEIPGSAKTAEQRQSELNAEVLAGLLAICACDPWWCARYQDYDACGCPVGGPYHQEVMYREADAGIGYISPFELIPIRRLAHVYPEAARYTNIPEELKVAGKPIRRRYEIVDGPWPRKDYACRACPNCGTADDYAKCYCGLRPVLAEFEWPLDELETMPPGYDPLPGYYFALENYMICEGDAAERRAQADPSVPGRDFRLEKEGVNQQVLVEYYSDDEPTPPWLGKLPRRLYVVASAPGEVEPGRWVGVSIASPIGVPSLFLRDPIDIEYPDRRDKLTLAQQQEAESKAVAALTALLDGYQDGPWWCCTYRELDTDGAELGEVYAGCAEVRLNPAGDGPAGAGQAEVVPLGSEGPHYEGAVERRRTLGPHYWLGAGESTPQTDCGQNCPACGEGAPAVGPGGGGSGVIMMAPMAFADAAEPAPASPRRIAPATTRPAMSGRVPLELTCANLGERREWNDWCRSGVGCKWRCASDRADVAAYLGGDSTTPRDDCNRDCPGWSPTRGGS